MKISVHTTRNSPLREITPNLDGEISTKENSLSKIFHPFETSHALRTTKDHRLLLRTSSFIDKAINEIGSIISRKNIKTLSFDVFDTALLRSPCCEAKRFYEVASRFSAANEGIFSAEDAFVARIDAAKAAYRFTPQAVDYTREGRIDLIAAVACAQLGVPGKQSQKVELELEYEIEKLVPNPLVKAIIDKFPDLNLIFISDMYLSAQQIQRLLLPTFNDAVVFSSADGNGSKRNGGLYKHTIAKMKIDADEILHFGDSLSSDYRGAKLAGLHGYLLPISDLERTQRLKCYIELAAKLNKKNIPLEKILPFNC